MDIILLKDLDKVGKANEIITVKDGFGRNYLIPKGLAIVANKKNRGQIEERMRQAREAEERLISVFQGIKEKLDGKILRIGAKAGTSGKIFGSVTNVQVAQAIKDETGADVERRKIELVEEVKTLGNYAATVSLHKEVTFQVNFEVFAD